MTLDEIMKAVESLPVDELHALREHIESQAQVHEIKAQNVGIDMNELLAAIDEMREGLTEEDIVEIVAAMNEEYIESDDADWAIG